MPNRRASISPTLSHAVAVVTQEDVRPIGHELGLDVDPGGPSCHGVVDEVSHGGREAVADVA